MSECTRKQNEIKKLELSINNLETQPASNLMEYYYSKINDLQQIPKILYSNNEVLKSEECVQQLCQIISNQTGLSQLDFSGLELSVDTACKILEACCKIKTLRSIPIELVIKNNMLESAENAELFTKCMQQQDKIDRSEIGRIMSGNEFNDSIAKNLL